MLKNSMVNRCFVQMSVSVPRVLLIRRMNESNQYMTVYESINANSNQQRAVVNVVDFVLPHGHNLFATVVVVNVTSFPDPKTDCRERQTRIHFFFHPISSGRHYLGGTGQSHLRQVTVKRTANSIQKWPFGSKSTRTRPNQQQQSRPALWCECECECVLCVCV